MKLSNRIRPNCEAAPWVIDEVERLEQQRDELQTKCDKLLDNMKYVESYLEGCCEEDALPFKPDNLLEDVRKFIAKAAGE